MLPRRWPTIFIVNIVVFRSSTSDSVGIYLTVFRNEVEASPIIRNIGESRRMFNEPFERASYFPPPGAKLTHLPIDTSFTLQLYHFEVRWETREDYIRRFLDGFCPVKKSNETLEKIKKEPISGVGMC